MSDLAPAVQAAGVQRAGLTAATQRLSQAWRDSQSAAFRRDTLETLGKEMSTMVMRLTEADHDVDRALRKLRDLGCQV